MCHWKKRKTKQKTKTKKMIGKGSKLCKCGAPSLKYLRNIYDLLYIHILYSYVLIDG